jgi:ELWxxDGT repeat protein
MPRRFSRAIRPQQQTTQPARPSFRPEPLEARTLLAGQLVRDINPATDHGYTWSFIEMDGVAYFAAEDGRTGRELWRSDGTAEGTWLVEDLVPGPGDGFPNFLTRLGDAILFNGPGGLWMTEAIGEGAVPVRTADGQQVRASGPLVELNGFGYFNGSDSAQQRSGLWRTDGTPAGTGLVSGHETGGPFDASSLHVHDGALYFSGWTPQAGPELYKSDGTAAGTVRVADLIPGPTGSQPVNFVSLGDTLFFQATTPDAGQELWKTDGTEAGTVIVKDIRPGPDSPGLISATAAAGLLFFGANDGTNGAELWRSDGTADGTFIVKDTHPDPFARGPTRIVPFADGVLYNGNDPVAGYELWRSDGTAGGTHLVKDTFPGPNGDVTPNPWQPMPGGRVLFAASPGLWVTDGTAAGTVMLAADPINIAFSGPSFPGVGGTMLFGAQTTYHGVELWATDGSPGGTRMLADVNAVGLGSAPHDLVPWKGALHLVASEPSLGATLWKSNGTGPGTAPVVPGVTHAFGGEMHHLTPAGDKLFFFQERQFPAGWRLRVTDGTQAGTRNVATLKSNAALQHHLTVGNRLYFYDYGENATDLRLWVTDGTAAGTTSLAGLPYNFLSFGRSAWAEVNGTLYFTAQDPVAGVELFKTDGTPQGTHVIDVGPANFGIEPFDLVNLNGTLFFSTITEGRSRLWKSDGTVAGTVVVKDFGATTGELLYLHEMTAAGNRVFFRTGEKSSPDKALWVSDGTEAGTVRLVTLRVEPQIVPGEPPEPHFNLTAAGTALFFTNYDPATGTELWFSDGTAFPGGLYADLRPGSASSSPADLVIDPQGLVYFPAQHQHLGREVWAAGTGWVPQVVGEVVAGAASSDPADLTWFNGALYYTADDGTLGRELYKVTLYSDAAVMGTHLFYNNSRFDGNDPAAGAADDAAIAVGKTALRAGQVPTFGHFSSYSRGINGVMIDVRGLRGDLGPDDFVFRAGRATAAANWLAAPAPLSITRRPGAGNNGADRVTIIWRDGAIKNRWLEVTVKPTADTNLPTPFTFSFGHLTGETGNPPAAGRLVVDAGDLSRWRLFTGRSSVPPVDPFDINRDGAVNGLDGAIIRANYGRGLLLNPNSPAPPVPAAASAPAPDRRSRLPRRAAYELLA